MNVFTEGSQALAAAAVGTLTLCWFALAFGDWLAYTFRKTFRG